MARIIEAPTREKRPTNRATVYLKSLGITELRKSDREGQRGWVWTGRKTQMEAAIKFRPAIRPQDSALFT
jgi:hypothetical protein